MKSKMPMCIGEVVNDVLTGLSKAKKRRETMSEEKKSKRVYTIIKTKKEGKKDFWLEIGKAFTNKDGSLNVLLNALPVNGTLQIRDETV